MSEDESLDLCVCGFVELLLIAGLVRTLWIHVRNKENILPIRRPDRRVGFASNRSQLVSSCHRAGRGIEVRDPDLRTPFLGRKKQKTFTVRRPAGTISILSRNDGALLASRCRYRPHMRYFGVCFQADIHGAE